MSTPELDQPYGVSEGASAKRRAGTLARIAMMLLPSILAFVYYGFIATNKYVSETQFVLRTATKPLGMGSFGALLQMSGLSSASNEVHSVQNFMTSRDAIKQLMSKLPLLDYYGRPHVDFLSRYPSALYGSTLDQLYMYFNGMVKPSYNSTTGITTLKVYAFEADDAKAIADTLLLLGEFRVNEMNERIHADAIRASMVDSREFENKLVEAQIAITRFRTKELTIDPLGSAVVMTELIAGLSAEQSRAEAQLRETVASAPNSPSLPAIRRRIDALSDQIRRERAKISDQNGGIAQQMAKYERLVLEREFAKAALSTASRVLEQARGEARRQQLYLERVVAPNLPDYPMKSDRYRMIWTVFSLNLVALLIGWLLYGGISQHRAGK